MVKEGSTLGREHDKIDLSVLLFYRIKSFEAGAACETFDQLWDGVILAQILHEM